jgi:tetratricopeptide (TPR) repeat protein
MRSHFQIIFFLLCDLLAVYGQDVEALKRSLREAKNDTSRISILASLAESASEEEWPDFNLQAKKMAEEKLSKIDPSDPLNKFYKRYLANAVNNEGYLIAQQGDNAKAIEKYKESLKLREEIGDKLGISNSLNNLGATYEAQGNIPKALEFYYAGLKIREELGVKESIAVSLINIGVVYGSQNEPEKALEFYQRSLKIQEEIGDLEHAAISLNNIGNIYSDKKENLKALECYQKSLKIREKLGDNRQISYSLNNIGMIYLEAGDPNEKTSKENSLKAGKIKALNNFETALKISEQINDKYGVISALTNIGFLYLEHKEYARCIPYCQKSYEMSKAAGYPRSINANAMNLYKAYKGLGKGDEALKYFEVFVVMRDSVRNQEFRKSTFKSQMKYEFEKKTKEDSLLVAEERKVTEAKLEKEKTQKYALYGGISLIALFAIFMVNRFTVIKKQKHLIELKEKETQMQKELIEEKQKEIIQSIQYAKRIQTSFLPTGRYISRILSGKDK